MVLFGALLRREGFDGGAQQILVASCTGFDEIDNEIGARHDLDSAATRSTGRLRVLKRSQSLKIRCRYKGGHRLAVTTQYDALTPIGDTIDNLGQTVAGFTDTEVFRSAYGRNFCKIRTNFTKGLQSMQVGRRRGRKPCATTHPPAHNGTT
jgi:hypothetical protein